MGIIPTPDEHGNDCGVCWAIGQTPSMLKCFLSGIERGGKWVDTLPAPPNGYWDLFQSPGTPCEFTNAPGPVRVYYHAVLVPGPGGANLVCRALGATLVFTTVPVPNCTMYFTNLQWNPFWEWYINGFAMITTPAKMQAMIELATPIVGPDPRMELFAMADGEIVVKFCNIQDGTNIKLKIDTALL